MRRLLRTAAIAALLLLPSTGIVPAAQASPTTPPPIPGPVITGKTPIHVDGAPLAQVRPQTALAGAINVTLVTLKTSDKTTAQTAAIDIYAAKAAVTSASNYWYTVSNGRLSLAVGTVHLGLTVAAASNADFSVLMDEAASAQKWTPGPNKVLMIMIPRGDVVVYGNGGNIGAGWSSGPTSGRILLPLTSNVTAPVVAHEIGHVFNLNHANSLQCGDGIHDTLRNGNGFTDGSCYSNEYGDDTDIMGITQAAEPYLNAYLYDYGQFGRGDEIQNLGRVAGTKGITLTPWAQGAANRAAKFADPVTGDVYYLQYRTAVGYDAATAVGNNSGVQILKADNDPSQSLIIPPSTIPYTGYYNPNLAWQVNTSFVTVGGTRININWTNGYSAGITIITPAVFNDIYQSGFRSDITWMSQQGLTTGWPDGSFHPAETMSREAMAAFMYRLAGSPTYKPPAVSPFRDVSIAAQFYKEVAWMQSMGVADGWDDGTYRPSTGMARDAMAAFLYRYGTTLCHNPATISYPEPATPKFTDVASAALFNKEIGWLADSGIAGGWPDGTYRPQSTLTREAMAAFTHRLSQYFAANGGC